ncbi:dTDP-glucose 4,6-dehydratase [Amycolatopsis decaplanina DSM 44594]|uniref:dTDP-glucose 4,6-dehydratase n=1 Tax=Amycolatopsis decaplanina DSM 44594 TaxID=1284240 RepID=M2YS09_9PSEU|nr:dTDP-glucose 4,6-dehydratase [Amycolatopsis decaplanina DSM 44594]
MVALDSLSYAGNEENLADVRSDVAFVQADIGDAEAVSAALREHSPDVVVNFAAESHNSLAVLNPGQFFRTNVLGTQVLLEACRQAGVERFHHVSTCEVYGDMALDDPGSFSESSPYRPRTPYSASKAGGDHAVRCYHETFGLPVTITNCSNNYGPFQYPEKILPLFTVKALAGEKLTLYKSSQNLREWIHVSDHCRAIDLVLRNGRVGETYHVGTGVEASIDQIANVVLDELGLPQDRKMTVPDRPGHDRRYLLDAEKIRAELGWTPQHEFEKSVRETIRWYEANEAWWRPLRERARVVEEAWTSGESK